MTIVFQILSDDSFFKLFCENPHKTSFGGKSLQAVTLTVTDIADLQGQSRQMSVNVIPVTKTVSLLSPVSFCVLTSLPARGSGFKCRQG